MSDFIREVDEEVRHDQFRRFLARYWIGLAALVVAVLVGVAAWETYDYVRSQRAEASGGRYLDALDLARAGKADEAEGALKALAADGTPGYRLMARFRLAGAVGAKDKAAGAAHFDAIASDAGVDPALQNVARLRAALLVLDLDSYADLRKRLDPLADANSAMRNAAREMLALAALKADRTEDAGRDLDAIEADPAATAQVRQRVAALQGLVRGVGASSPVAASTPAAPAASPAAPAAAAPQAAPVAPAMPVPAPAATSETPDVAPVAPPAPAGPTPITPAPATPAPAPAP